MKGRNTPQYDLTRIKAAFNTSEKLVMTFSALHGKYQLQFNDQDVVDAIQALTKNDFYKSMQPIHSDYSSWQDVYKPSFKGHKLYIKFQVNKNGEVIISFKAR